MFSFFFLFARVKLFFVWNIIRFKVDRCSWRSEFIFITSIGASLNVATVFLSCHLARRIERGCGSVQHSPYKRISWERESDPWLCKNPDIPIQRSHRVLADYSVFQRVKRQSGPNGFTREPQISETRSIFIRIEARVRTRDNYVKGITS